MRLYFIIAVVFFANAASASLWEQAPAFNKATLSEHNNKMDKMMDVASACLEEHLQEHLSFHDRYRISKFIGDRTSVVVDQWQYGKKGELVKFLNPIIDQIETKTGVIVPLEARQQIRTTSCIGLTLNCLGRGFSQTGQKTVWEEVLKFYRANGRTGLALQVALMKLGWRSLYWNPDPSQNAKWDKIEKEKNEKNFNGHHAHNYNKSVNPPHMYYPGKSGVPIDDFWTLVDFGTQPPQSFKQIPFFVGIAHIGYHVFPGHYGHVIEAHSTRKLTDRQTVEDSAFNPLVDGGGPRGTYRSGVMVIPPGYGL